MVLDSPLAGNAKISRAFRIFVLPADTRELQHLVVMAEWARHPIAPLIRFLVSRFNPARSGSEGRRAEEDLAARKGSCSRHREHDWIAFSVHIERIRIHLVQKQIPGRHRTQSDRTVRTRHDQDSAGKFFGKNGVAAIARARALYQIPEHRALFDQRVDALLRVAFGHFDGRLDGHNRPRRVMNHVSQKVVAAFGTANLSAFHEHHPLIGRGGG
jgi:hypothetical protein